MYLHLVEVPTVTVTNKSKVEEHNVIYARYIPTVNNINLERGMVCK